MNKTTGFTLVELMIVVAIIGILSVIAYPSYQETVRKSRRTDAEGALLGFANAMERFFTETNNYCDAGTMGVSVCGTASLDTGPSTIFAISSPVDGTDTFYNLSISAVSATTYTLSAVPAGNQVGDICGTLTLTNTGVKAVSSGSVTDCW